MNHLKSAKPLVIVIVTVIVVAAFASSFAVLHHSNSGSKELNTYCDKIQLKNAKTLGPIYKEFMIASEKMSSMVSSHWLGQVKNQFTEPSFVVVGEELDGNTGKIVVRTINAIDLKDTDILAEFSKEDGNWRIIHIGGPVIVTRSDMRENTSLALSFIRVLSVAQEKYRKDSGTNSYGTLAQLSNATHPYIISTLGAGISRGYRITIIGTPDANTWAATAVPNVPGVTGTRGFFVDESGVIRYTTDGSAPTIVSPGLSP